MVRAYSVNTNLSPEAAAVMVGLGMVVIAGAMFWYRKDLYSAYQWIVRYPQRGVAYMVAQIGVPVAVFGVGVALILWPVVRW